MKNPTKDSITWPTSKAGLKSSTAWRRRQEQTKTERKTEMDLNDLLKNSKIRREVAFTGEPAPIGLQDPLEALGDQIVTAGEKELRRRLGLDQIPTRLKTPPPDQPGGSLISKTGDEDADLEQVLNDWGQMPLEDFKQKWAGHPLGKALSRFSRA